MINWGNKIAISVAGGKGGVGKSCFTTNLGVAFSQLGKRVLLVDADFGGANLHTLVGIPRPQYTLSDFYNGKKMSLDSVIVETPYENISLLSSADDTLPSLVPDEKIQDKLNDAVHNLDTDVLIFDISSGTHRRALDFFSFTPIGIILIELIPTSLENAFTFIKHLLLRSLLRLFHSDEEMSQFIHKLIDPRNNNLRDRFSDNNYRMYIVANSVHDPELLPVADKFAKLVKRYLDLNLKILGNLPYEQLMNTAITKRTPFVIKYPESEYMKIMQVIAKNILSTYYLKSIV